MTNEIKSKKWLWVVGGIFLLIIIIVVASSNGEKEKIQSTSQPASQQTGVSGQKFSFENYIKADKIREFTIIKEQDISIKALGGNNPSDFSIQELEALPVNLRMKYQIVVPRDISEEELKSTFSQIIKEKATANPEIDAITVQAWESEGSLNGGNPAIGYAEWCPNGKWEEMTPRIARDNTRDSYKIVYNIDKQALESIKETKEENLFGLTLQQRKEFFKNLVGCEDQGDNEAMQYYFPGCESCSKFIIADIKKYSEKANILIDVCKESLRKQYGLTEETGAEIITEAFQQRWPMSEFVPSPSCCNF